MHVSNSNSTELKTNTYYGSNNQEKQFRHTMEFRFISLLLLLALLYVPVYFIERAFDDHFAQQQRIVKELSDQWGQEQTLIGPILSIPYVERVSKISSQTDSNGIKSSVSKDIFNSKTLMLLPENLRLNANLKDKILSEDNVKAHVYEGDIELSGNFNLEALPEPSAYTSIEWDKAFLAIGVQNNQQIKIASPLRWEDGSTGFQPGTNLPNMLNSGFHANLEEVASDAELPQFKIQIQVKGAHQFKFAPVGELTTASISSDSKRITALNNIKTTSSVRSEDNFEAIWRISNLVRNYPQQWLIEDDTPSEIQPDFFKVLSGITIDNTTAAKDQSVEKIQSILAYIIPVLGILFLSMMLLEFKRNSHSKPKFLHYVVVAMSVFATPLILLTIKDQTNFEQAYQIAAGTSIFLIVIYMMLALRSFFEAFYLLLVLACLYGALYIHLNLPEFSLFALSAAMLIITVLLILASIKIYERES